PDGTVLDGELVIWKAPPDSDEQAFGVQPFALLQQRIGRKTLGKKLLDELPAALLAYDLLEWQGEDWRSRPQHERRSQLEHLVDEHPLAPVLLSPLLQGPDWADLARQREQSRSLGVE
ncbi:ATP-dependent DNA ligase, partial [Klebsiella pneumoniae]|uniref:ATP-dependent DNA ligase n=1 Tax=Klebsiella pneumoniae TaxID=573 RepID=UPI0017CC70DE|nr:ATP-dependent DNA ligase [Klebsiella pneumoniae]